MTKNFKNLSQPIYDDPIRRKRMHKIYQQQKWIQRWLTFRNICGRPICKMFGHSEVHKMDGSYCKRCDADIKRKV